MPLLWGSSCNIRAIGPITAAKVFPEPVGTWIRPLSPLKNNFHASFWKGSGDQPWVLNQEKIGFKQGQSDNKLKSSFLCFKFAKWNTPAAAFCYLYWSRQFEAQALTNDLGDFQFLALKCCLLTFHQRQNELILLDKLTRLIIYHKKTKNHSTNRRNKFKQKIAWSKLLNQTIRQAD